MSLDREPKHGSLDRSSLASGGGSSSTFGNTITLTNPKSSEPPASDYSTGEANLVFFSQGSGRNRIGLFIKKGNRIQRAYIG